MLYMLVFDMDKTTVAFFVFTIFVQIHPGQVSSLLQDTHYPLYILTF